MQDWIIQMMDQFGYWGIGGLIAIENIFPPIPSEVILTFGGFMTTYTSLNVWLVILAATLGSLVGAIILYGIGRIISPRRLEKILAGRLGKILRLKPEDIGKAETWFQKRGKLTVFFCRFIPLVRSLISIPAGMAKMNLGIFLLLSAAGTAIWNTVLVWLGVFAGASWEKIVEYMGIYSSIGLAAFGAAIVILIVVFYKKRLSKKKKAEAIITKMEENQRTEESDNLEKTDFQPESFPEQYIEETFSLEEKIFTQLDSENKYR